MAEKQLRITGGDISQLVGEQSQLRFEGYVMIRRHVVEFGRKADFYLQGEEANISFRSETNSKGIVVKELASGLEMKGLFLANVSFNPTYRSESLQDVLAYGDLYQITN